MMHPEKCSSEKNNLEFYQVGHDGFSSNYEDKGNFNTYIIYL